MKITKRQLRRIIRESLTEGTLYVTRGPYGITIEDENEEYVAVDAMISTLIAAGDDDIFNAPQGVDEHHLAKLQQHQGGYEGFDPDEFEDYYNVDLDRVVRLYARRMNYNIKDVPYEEY